MPNTPIIYKSWLESQSAEFQEAAKLVIQWRQQQPRSWEADYNMMDFFTCYEGNSSLISIPEFMLPTVIWSLKRKLKNHG